MSDTDASLVSRYQNIVFKEELADLPIAPDRKDWMLQSLSTAIYEVVEQLETVLQSINCFKKQPEFHNLYVELNKERDDIRFAIAQRVLKALYESKVPHFDEAVLERSLRWALDAWIAKYEDRYRKLLLHLVQRDEKDASGYISPGMFKERVNRDDDALAYIGEKLSVVLSSAERRKQIIRLSKKFDMHSFERLQRASFMRLKDSYPDLRQIGDIYSRHTLAPSVFEDLEDEKYEKVQSTVASGSMIHLFNPPLSEVRQVFKTLEWGDDRVKAYKSPMRQLRENINGSNGMVGEYRVMGIYDESGKTLLAWISYRLPPKKPRVSEELSPDAWKSYREKLEQYKRQVVNFFTQKAQMDQGIDLEEIQANAGTTMEIDTISSDIPGGGTAIMNRLMEEARQEYPDLTHIFLVRYGDMRIVGRRPRDMPNYASGEFFRRRGFVSEGHIFDSNEVAWRKIDYRRGLAASHGYIFVHPKWIVMRASFKEAYEASKKEWRQMQDVAASIRAAQSSKEAIYNDAYLHEQPDPNTRNDFVRNFQKFEEESVRASDRPVGLHPLGEGVVDMQ